MHIISLFFLCLLVIIVPWETNFVIPGLASAARIIGVLAFGLGILKVAFRGRLRPPPWEMIWFALFIGWCLAGVSWSINMEASVDRTITFVLLFTFVWLIWELADTPDRQKALMRAFVAGTTILVFNVYLNSIGRGVSLESEDRATAAAANPNGVATVCCMAIQYALFLITRREKGKFEVPNWFYWGFIAAAGIAIPMTGSRMGLVSAFIVGVAFLPLLRQALRGSGWKNAVILVVIAAVIGIMGPRLASQGSLERLREGIGARTFQERIEIWQRGLRAWSETPYLGVGPGAYEFAGLSVGEKHYAAHNTYVSVLVESGIVGSVIYFAFWFVVVLRIFRMPGKDRFFWLVFFVSLQPTMLTGSGEYYKFWWLVGAQILCAAANAKQARPAGRRFLVYPLRTPGPALRPPPPSTP